MNFVLQLNKNLSENFSDEQQGVGGMFVELT